MDDNWDLGAIVRSSTVAAEETKTTTAAAGNENNPANRLSFLSSIKFEDDDDPFSFPNLLMSRTNGLDELEDSCKPFFSSSSAMSNSPTPGQNAAAAPPPTVTAATSPVGSINSTFFVNVETTLTAPQQQPYPPLPVEDQVLYPRQQPEIGSSGIFQRSAQQPQPASRSSRKSLTPPKKLVCHVTAENLSSDLWAWRKYGQKPIKNSPYPRNYYRCSSTKACTARKQVERSKTDPTVFIVSYTGDHNHPRPTHRNSLAGSTRGKYTRNRQNHAGRDDQNNTGSEAVASCSSPLSATSLSPTTPLPARTEGENMNVVDETNADDVLIPNFAAMTNEYIFQKMEELGGRTAIPDRERMRGGGTAAGGGACFGGGGVSF